MSATSVPSPNVTQNGVQPKEHSAQPRLHGHAREKVANRVGSPTKVKEVETNVSGSLP